MCLDSNFLFLLLLIHFFFLSSRFKLVLWVVCFFFLYVPLSYYIHTNTTHNDMSRNLPLWILISSVVIQISLTLSLSNCLLENSLYFMARQWRMASSTNFQLTEQHNITIDPEINDHFVEIQSINNQSERTTKTGNTVICKNQKQKYYNRKNAI